MTSAPPRVRVSPRLLHALVDRRRSLAMFERLAARGHDVVEFRPVGRRVWLVNEPGLARRVLVDAGRSVAKGEGLRAVRWVLGDGLLTTNDVAQHRRHRRLIQPVFTATRMQRYAEVMVAAAQATADRWQDGAVVEMSEQMARLTLEVVGRTLMGADTDQDAQSIYASLETVLKRFGLGFLPGSDRIMRSSLPPAVAVRRAVESMRRTVERIVARHQTGESTADDMVAALVAARDEGVGLTDEQVRNETLTLLLAGHETTATDVRRSVAAAGHDRRHRGNDAIATTRLDARTRSARTVRPRRVPRRGWYDVARLAVPAAS